MREWDKLVVKNNYAARPRSSWDLFTGWLTEMYEEANQTNLCSMYISGRESSGSAGAGGGRSGAATAGVGGTGANAGRGRGRDSSHTVVSHLTNVRKITSKEDLKEYNKLAKEFSGPCPVCHKHHTYSRDFAFGKADVHS